MLYTRYPEDVLVASVKRFVYDLRLYRTAQISIVNMHCTVRTDRERRSADGRVNIAEIRNGCLLLNTAEYCQVTSSEARHSLSILSHICYGGRLTSTYFIARGQVEGEDQ